MRKYIILFFIMIFHYQTLLSQSEENDTRVNIQIAGNIGHVSLGWGSNNLFKQIMLDFHYGYYHHSKSKMQVHTLALKSSYQLWQFDQNKYLLAGYVGATIAYSLVNNTFLRYPSYFPNSYYDFPNAIHLFPYFGVLNKIKAYPMGLYFEIGSADYLLIVAFRNKSIKPHQIFNLAVGVHFYL